MIIDLSKSKIFTQDPALRFAKEYALPKDTWDKIWRRYILLQYSNGDLRDYIFIRYGRNLHFMAMQRWIIRAKVYEIAQLDLKRGRTQANTVIFGELEEFVMNELVKPLRNGGNTKSKSII